MSETTGRNVKVEQECPKCAADEITGWMEFPDFGEARLVAYKCECGWGVTGSYEDPPVPTLDGEE